MRKYPPAGIIPEALGGSYKATVTIVDSVFDAASGTFGVRLELPKLESSVLVEGKRCSICEVSSK